MMFEDRHFDYRWLDIFLDQIPQRHKIVIKKTVLAELPDLELAKEFNVSKQRIYSMRKQAFRMLKKLMDEYNNELFKIGK